MALQLHVNGTAQIWSGTGTANALEQLGVSVDGVTIQLNTEYDEIFTDHYGPKVPYDLQYFLQDALIKCELVWYEQTVLYKWLTGTPGAGLTLGVMGAAGNLAVQNALASRLLIKSTPATTGLTTVENCWNFLNVVLVDQHETKVGVEKTVWNLTFRALLTQVASGSVGAVLFNQVCV